MSDRIVEAQFWLCVSDRVGKGAAARYDDTAAAAVCQDFDPASEISRACKAAAELDHGDALATHLVGGPSLARDRGK